MKKTPHELALILIQETKDALARGTRHYHPTTGAELLDVKSILECLTTHGSVVFEPEKGGRGRLQGPRGKSE
jgi:hypothetical protein